MANWNKISSEVTHPFKGADDILNEFNLVFSLRKEYPVHFTLFKRLAVHLAHEANAETTFSLSGSLSNSNKHTGPDFLSTCVRINKNKKIYNPSRDEVLKAYRSKFGKDKDEEDLQYADGEDSDGDANNANREEEDGESEEVTA